jgi:thiosulfate dehydrogenase [quinone] large subunit
MFTMTRTKIYVMTAISAAVYVALGVVFADNFFTGGDFFNSDALADSSFLSWLLLAAIIGGGVFQASRIPESGVAINTEESDAAGQIKDPTFWRLFISNSYFAVLWMPLRFFVGKEWLAAGEHKVRDSAWMDTGTALQGYFKGAVAIPEQGRPAITYGWFRDFLQYMLDHEWYTWFAKVVAVGEVLVGLGLIVGAMVGIAAFFGTLMNFNFQLAGSASTNPVLFGLGVFLVVGWKVAGHLGLDRVLLPMLGTPWSGGRVFHRHNTPLTEMPIGGRSIAD